MNSTMDIPGCLLMAKAHDIINGEHNDEHELLLINGYIRQNIQQSNNVIIVDNINQTFQLFLGTMRLIIIDKIEYKINQQQSEIDLIVNEINKQQQISTLILEQMIECGQNISNKQQEALNITKEVDQEMKQINERTEVVEAELAEAKPALQAAQNAISNIRKSQVNHVKVLRNPPQRIHMTLTAVCILMGNKVSREKKTKVVTKLDKQKINALIHGFVRVSLESLLLYIPDELIEVIALYTIILKTETNVTFNCCGDWKRIQKMLGRNDFIPSILKFDTNKIKEKTRKQIEKYYILREDFTFERVNKASKVVGPLVLWVKAQLKFAYLLDCVEPMTKEIKEMKSKLLIKQQHAKDLNQSVKELENKLEEYKHEYKRTVKKELELENYMDTTAKSQTIYRDLLKQLIN